MKPRTVLLCLLTFVCHCVLHHPLSGRTLYVGPSDEFTSIVAGVEAAQPGDSVIVRAGEWPGGNFLTDIQGSAGARIYLLGERGEGEVIISGGTEAMHISNPAWLHISGFVFEGQRGNGVNIDDGGDYATPAQQVEIEGCIFRNIDADGNNDLLKLSGLDNFSVRQCTFVNGAAGGSGIDMVGCHEGVIEGNIFSNLGASGIQAKGGTQFITIRRNRFDEAGARAVNLGGSTGLAFFRPIDAPFEAADLYVYANIFTGSEAPVAYVGSVRVEVVNNTIIKPDKWVFRVLQENVDPQRFVLNGDNTFRNNLVVTDARLSAVANIGPDTRPESYTVDHNLWFDIDRPDVFRLEDIIFDARSVWALDPRLEDATGDEFKLRAGSPAIGRGRAVEFPQFDHEGRRYGLPRSIGAFEFDDAVATTVQALNESNGQSKVRRLHLYPNPAGDVLRFELPPECLNSDLTVRLMSVSGKTIKHEILSADIGRNDFGMALADLAPGVYLLFVSGNGIQMLGHFLHN